MAIEYMSEEYREAVAVFVDTCFLRNDIEQHWTIDFEPQHAVGVFVHPKHGIVPTITLAGPTKLPPPDQLKATSEIEQVKLDHYDLKWEKMSIGVGVNSTHDVYAAHDYSRKRTWLATSAASAVWMSEALPYLGDGYERRLAALEDLRHALMDRLVLHWDQAPVPHTPGPYTFQILGDTVDLQKLGVTTIEDLGERLSPKYAPDMMEFFCHLKGLYDPR